MASAPRRDGGGQAFFVSDDGAGFDPAFARHLFGAFQRVHPAGEFTGNGVGLATVQRLVAATAAASGPTPGPGREATFSSPCRGPALADRQRPFSRASTLRGSQRPTPSVTTRGDGDPAYFAL